MESNQPLLNEIDINLEPLDIKLEPINITFSPFGNITLNPIEVNLNPLPVKLDNTLFEELDFTSFEDLGGLV